MDSADNAETTATIRSTPARADVAAASAWRLLLTHQRDDTGFCRVCRDHWPCAPNAEALTALAALTDHVHATDHPAGP